MKALLDHPDLVENAVVGVSLIHNSPYLVLRDGEVCNMTSVTYLPYELRKTFGIGTPCPSYLHQDGELDHLSIHNQYSIKEAQATMEALVESGNEVSPIEPKNSFKLCLRWS